MKTSSLTALALMLIVSAVAVNGQTIVQGRGADPQLDYDSLTRFGPWDDRNYQLTRADIALLADDEASLDTLVPAFFRVEMRQRLPLRSNGLAQYPLSAVPQFNMKYGGYLIDGQYYHGARREGDRFVVDLERPVPAEGVAARGGLVGEARVTLLPGGSTLGAAESAIAFHPTNPDLVVAGSNGPSGSQRQHWSSDGGTTWTQVELPLGGACCDPTMAYSSDGTFAYTATLSGAINANWFYRSSDNGQSWDDLATIDGDPRREIGGGGSDKEFIHVDVSSSIHQDNIYLTWHQGNVLRFSRSTDFGHTWSTPLVFSSDPIGIGSDITSDRNGNIFYAYLSFANQTVLSKTSTDGGLTFTPAVVVDNTNGAFTYVIPAQNSRGVPMIASMDVDLSDGPFSNSVYIAWPDANAPESAVAANNHSQIKVAYSRDQGATWTVTIPHETADVLTVDRWQSWVRVAPNGDVYTIFYDTRNFASRNGIDVYVSRSTDGAQTWGTPQRMTTTSSPALVGTNFQFGDYNGMDIVMNDLIAIFTDNRDETGGTAQSRDVWVAGMEINDDSIFSDGFESGSTIAWSNTLP